MAGLHKLPATPESAFLTDCVKHAYGIGVLDGKEQAEAEAAAAAAARPPITSILQLVK